MSSLEFLPLGTDSLTHSLQARLPQIQFVLDLPQHVVVDAALLAQADGSLLAADLVRRRVELVAENALLRQQLIVAKRKIAGRVMWSPGSASRLF